MPKKFYTLLQKLRNNVFRMAVLAMSLSGTVDVDINKCVRMALVHGFLSIITSYLAKLQFCRHSRIDCWRHNAPLWCNGGWKIQAWIRCFSLLCFQVYRFCFRLCRLSHLGFLRKLAMSGKNCGLNMKSTSLLKEMLSCSSINWSNRDFLLSWCKLTINLVIAC